MDWDYWFTVTDKFQQNTSRISSCRSAKSWRRGLHDLHEYAGSRRLFWGLEAHRSGALHVHGLIELPVDVRKPGLEKAEWDRLRKFCTAKFGRSDIERYDRDLGAAHYVSKYVAKELNDWDIWIR